MPKVIHLEIGADEAVARFRRFSEPAFAKPGAPRVSRTSDERVFRLQFYPNDRAMLARPAVRARVLRRKRGADLSLEPEMNPRGLVFVLIGLSLLVGVTLLAKSLPGGEQVGVATVILPGACLFVLLLAAHGALGRTEVERAQAWAASRLARDDRSSSSDLHRPDSGLESPDSVPREGKSK